MLSRKKISDRIGAFYYHPISILVVNLIVGVIIFVVGQIFIDSESVRTAFTWLLVAFEAAATIVIYWFRYEFRRYFRQEFIQEIVSLDGRTTRDLQVNIVHKDNGKGITTLYPGKEYIVNFNVKGGLLFKNPLSRKLTPALQVIPPLFLRNINPQKAEKDVSTWIGSVEPDASFEHSNSWSVKGKIPFDTSKINPNIKPAKEVRLVLEFREGDTIVFMFELGKFVVHLMDEQDMLSTLIKLGALKKIPPGYNVLPITDEFFTNIVFLPQVLIDKKRAPDTEDEAEEVEAAIASRINDKFQELQQRNSQKTLGLLMYGPEPSEQDLNHPEFMNSVVSAPYLVKPIPSKPEEQQVYVSIFQTTEFLSRLVKEHSLGICVFGFKQRIPVGVNLSVIFDLSNIVIEQSIMPADECVINKFDLDKLVDCSEEHFQKYGPSLAKKLSPPKPEAEFTVDQEADVPSNSSLSLDILLGHLQNPFDKSQKRGHFVVSEPELTELWVNLAIFSSELNKHRLNKPDLRKELIQAIFYVIDGAIKDYHIDRKNLSIVNLCSKHSGIANELNILWNLDQISKAKYNIPCYNVAIDSKSGEVTLEPELEPEYEDTGSVQSRDVILLIPLDTYVKVIKRVLEHVRRQKINVISVISLFSIATNWGFVTASEYFDVYPLFRVDPDPKNQDHYHSRRITQRDDVRRLRPWLNQ
jgi:hypothetical protein